MKYFTKGTWIIIGIIGVLLIIWGLYELFKPSKVTVKNNTATNTPSSNGWLPSAITGATNLINGVLAINSSSSGGCNNNAIGCNTIVSGCIDSPSTATAPYVQVAPIANGIDANGKDSSGLCN